MRERMTSIIIVIKPEMITHCLVFYNLLVAPVLLESPPCRPLDVGPEGPRPLRAAVGPPANLELI